MGLDWFEFERIRSAVMKFGNIDIRQADVPFYCYWRTSREHQGNLEFAWYDPDDQSINVELPTINMIHDEACLAFVFLHELAHADGVDDEFEASQLAGEQMKVAGVLSSHQIEFLIAGWQKSNDSDALTRESFEVIRRRGIDVKMASPEQINIALDEARINLLCGRA